VLALVPFMTGLLFSLPHPLIEIWIVWLFFAIYYLGYLFRRRDHSGQLSKTGELMNFREIFAVGCVGGFILLTFVTAFCTYLILKTKELI
jgi:hypothetical protein